MTTLLFSFNQENHTVLFHEYSPTASSWNIIKWNIEDTSNVRFILEETIDQNGRVTELRFLENGEIISDPLCYLATRVTFEYEGNSIIETLYHSNDLLLKTECEMHYKTVYHLNSEDIERVEAFYEFDTINVPEEIIIEIKKNIPEYSNYLCSDSINTEVDYYYHSFSKMNGIYPVNRGYQFDPENYYYVDQPEGESIENSLKNKNKR